MRKLCRIFIVAVWTPFGALLGQHRHPPAAQQRDSAARRDTLATGQQQQQPMQAMMQMMMGPLGISMSREASGTSWLPDSSPMYAYHRMTGSWLVMLHGNAFLQYIRDGGDRGDDQFGSTNWGMGMARRKVGGGDLMFRAMMSAEPLTVGECGYPDLLATGESCDGEPLHDRQHPHDLFMELAASYERPLSRSIAFQLYGGPVGEPALGPAAFPHRISAMPGPLATIGHHWQDATHISFGVATAGLFGRRWKLEGSLFNGREPDESRYDFDLDRLDSYSGRIWIMPNERWALQASAGRLTEAEAPRETGEGRADVTRTTASATYHQGLGMRGTWASTLLWGRNRAHGLSTDAFLIESNANLDERNVFFGRGEVARKSGEDLVIEDEAPALADEVFTVGKLSFGYVRQFANRGALIPGIGAQISLNFIPSDLERFYGSRSPVGLAVFVSIKPQPMRMEQMGHPTTAAAPGHAGHTRSRDSAQAGRDTAGHAGRQTMGAMPDTAQMVLMHEIHMRMMADPVIRERIATDLVLQRLLQRMPPEMRGDTTGVHVDHRVRAEPADTTEARQVMEFVTLLLSDPKVEARMRADPALRRLWSDASVRRCLETMRRLKASGQPLPASCPAAPGAGAKHDNRQPPERGLGA